MLYTARRKKALCRFWVMIKVTQGNIEYVLYTIGKRKALYKFWVVIKNIWQWAKLYDWFICNRKIEKKIIYTCFYNSIINILIRLLAPGSKYIKNWRL